MRANALDLADAALATVIGHRLIHLLRMRKQRGRVCRDGKQKGVACGGLPEVRGPALRVLKPKNVMHESISGDLDGVHILAVQAPKIERGHSSQGYQNNPEHYLL